MFRRNRSSPLQMRTGRVTKRHCLEPLEESLSKVPAPSHSKHAMFNAVTTNKATQGTESPRSEDCGGLWTLASIRKSATHESRTGDSRTTDSRMLPDDSMAPHWQPTFDSRANARITNVSRTHHGRLTGGSRAAHGRRSSLLASARPTGR